MDAAFQRAAGMETRIMHGTGDITGGRGEASADTRMLRARLNFLVATMSSAVWVNPILALLWVTPFTGLFPIFGRMSWTQFGVIMSLQFGVSIAGRFLHGEYHRDPSNSERWLRRLALYQAIVGSVWGLFPWFLWNDGNLLNNVLVAMTTSGIIWAYAFTRSMHWGVYLAGVTPTVLLTIARIAEQPDEASLPLALITAINFCVVYVFTTSQRRQVEVMLRTKFANDDLAVELREARDEALRKRFEAEAANASKTTFLANMSHELRTPLNAILGFSELISNETLGPVGTKRYREYAQDINASGSHLLSLINDILDIAKIESGKMEILPSLVDPRAAIESALNVVKVRALEKHQSLTIDVDDGAGDLYADERAFRQIVINLVSNAVKFTPEGGNIAVSVKKGTGGNCELCVSDDGPGIPATLLDQIFLPFNQVDNRYSRQAGGTGLGLSLVRGLAELHGGKAWIESDAGNGVRAHVTLPAAPRESKRRLRA